MSYKPPFHSIQQDRHGRYYDHANEFGGSGGDVKPDLREYRDPTPEERAEYHAHRLEYMRSQGYTGHDREPTICAPDCCCPRCIIRAAIED